MKYKFFKTATLSISAVLMLLMSGCLKTAPNYTDFSQVSDFVILKGAGPGNIRAANIASSPDTITLTVTADLASANSNNGPVKVTIGVDNSQIATYNAAKGTNFQPFPASAFKIISNSITIPGGLNHYGSTTIEVYHNQLPDPTVSYLLPISITDASGKKLSSNQNTIYFNVIGNPIAGNYHLYGSRWKKADSIGGSSTANFYKLDGGIVTFAAATPTEVQVSNSQSFFGETDIIDFKNNNGVLSNFTFTFPSSTASDVGVATWGPAVMEVADYVHGYYRASFQYSLSSGAVRTIVYEFIKQ